MLGRGLREKLLRLQSAPRRWRCCARWEGGGHLTVLLLAYYAYTSRVADLSLPTQRAALNQGQAASADMSWFLHALTEWLRSETVPGTPEHREAHARAFRERSDELRKPPGQRNEARVLELSKRCLRIRIRSCQVTRKGRAACSKPACPARALSAQSGWRACQPTLLPPSVSPCTQICGWTCLLLAPRYHLC